MGSSVDSILSLFILGLGGKHLDLLTPRLDAYPRILWKSVNKLYSMAPQEHTV